MERRALRPSAAELGGYPVPLASSIPTQHLYLHAPDSDSIPTPPIFRQASLRRCSRKNRREALAGLVAQHPDLKRHLYTDDGKLRAFVNVYVNDEDMRYLQKEATALKDGDTISIVPSIAGGCCPG